MDPEKLLNRLRNIYFKDDALNADLKESEIIYKSEEKNQSSNHENHQMSFAVCGDDENEPPEVLSENYENENFSTFLADDTDYYKQQLAFLFFYAVPENNLLKDLEKHEMTELYKNIEEPLIKVLAEMEYRGVAIDRDYLKVLIVEFNKQIEAITKEIFEASGEEFNINSPQQLSRILYGKLNLKPRRKTKTGLSTDAATLLSLMADNPIIEKILDYREKVKLDVYKRQT